MLVRGRIIAKAGGPGCGGMTLMELGTLGNRTKKDKIRYGSAPGGGAPPASKEYQPKTGARCSCRPGQQRDNCPNCEGTGMVVDFAAIRARRSE